MSTELIYVSVREQCSTNEVLTFESNTLKEKISQYSSGEQQLLLLKMQ